MEDQVDVLGVFGGALVPRGEGDPEKCAVGNREAAQHYGQVADLGVVIGGRGKHAIEPGEELAERAARPGFLPEEQSGEGGAQGDRVEGRDYDGNGDGDRELLIEAPGDAGNATKAREASLFGKAARGSDTSE